MSWESGATHRELVGALEQPLQSQHSESSEEHDDLLDRCRSVSGSGAFRDFHSGVGAQCPVQLSCSAVSGDAQVRGAKRQSLTLMAPTVDLAVGERERQHKNTLNQKLAP